MTGIERPSERRLSQTACVLAAAYRCGIPVLNCQYRQPCTKKLLGNDHDEAIVRRPVFRVDLLFPYCPSLSDSQEEGAAGSAARAAKIACGPARSIDFHTCCSRTGDHGRGERDLQFLSTHFRSAKRCSVDDHDRRRNKLATIHSENNTLLHLIERNSVGRKRPNNRGGTSASACGIECVATWQQ